MRGLTKLSTAWLTAAVLAALVIGGWGLLSWAGSDGPAGEPAEGSPTASGQDGWTARTAEAGEVTVTATPRRISPDGAAFRVAFDTHSVELDAPMPQSATLRVGGVEWPSVEWDGDGPGGHHREGMLVFDGAGPPDGRVVLGLRGLPEPVTMTWGE